MLLFSPGIFWILVFNQNWKRKLIKKHLCVKLQQARFTNIIKLQEVSFMEDYKRSTVVQHKYMGVVSLVNYGCSDNILQINTTIQCKGEKGTNKSQSLQWTIE